MQETDVIDGSVVLKVLVFVSVQMNYEIFHIPQGEKSIFILVVTLSVS